MLDNIKNLEVIQEYRDFIDIEAELWLKYKNELDNIYLEEEKYWIHRSRQKWLEEGDNNTKYFHTVASHRSKRKQNS